MENHGYNKEATKIPTPNTEDIGALNSSEKISDNTKKIVKMGRPRKSEAEKYKKVGIRLHPEVIERAKAEAAKRGIGYQSVINETLLEHLG